jgi:anti-sigma factor RsiW
MREIKDLCLDEGVLQGYLDGELSPAMMETAASHLAACEACARTASEAEQEMALCSAAFAPEMALNVPTEQLRARVNRAIEDLGGPAPSFQLKRESRLRAWLGSLSSALSVKPQYAAGFASLVVIIAFAVVFAAVFMRRNTETTVNNPGEVAQVKPTPAPSPDKGENAGSVGTAGGNQPVSSGTAAPDKKDKTSPGKKSGKGAEKNSPEPPTRRNDNRTLPPVEELPGEKDYLKTIASLEKAIETEAGTTALSPSLRAEYERNLAVVNQAIAATQPAARSKPNDPGTAQFLYSAYQSKIDLLTAVAEQQQFVARR